MVSLHILAGTVPLEACGITGSGFRQEYSYPPYYKPFGTVVLAESPQTFAPEVTSDPSLDLVREQHLKSVLQSVLARHTL